MQIDPQKCAIKMRKFHLIIFWRLGVIEESSQEEAEIPSSGLERVMQIWILAKRYSTA